MRIEIVFRHDRSLILPIHYNKIIQGFLYNSISDELADKLHNEGYPYEKRQFKLFTFSRILGRYRLNKWDGTIEFSSPSKLIVSSPVERFVQELGNEFLRSGLLHLGQNEVSVEQVNIQLMPVFSEKMRIRMLSPITIYSTLKKADGSSKTYYYSPFESEFSELLEANLKKKASIISEYNDCSVTVASSLCGDIAKNKIDEYSFTIEPTRVRNNDQKILTYKGFVIKCWMGEYKIIGSPQLYRVAYDAGLGGKNSQGFGCFEVISLIDGQK